MTLAEFAQQHRRPACIVCAIEPSILEQVNEGFRNNIPGQLVQAWLKTKDISLGTTTLLNHKKRGHHLS